MPEERPENTEEPQTDAPDQPEDAASAALRAAREALASIQAEADAAAEGANPESQDDPASKSQVEADAEAQMLADLAMQEAIQDSAQAQDDKVPPANSADMGRGVGVGPTTSNAKPLELPDFDLSSVQGAQHGLDLLADVQLDVRIELGRTRMLVEDVLRLNAGAVVELDKLAGDPLDVFVNDRLVARGEVLVLNDNFCIRVNEIIDSTGEGGEGQDS